MQAMPQSFGSLGDIRSPISVTRRSKGNDGSYSSRATMYGRWVLHAKLPTSLPQSLKALLIRGTLKINYWRHTIVLPRGTLSMPTFQSNPFRPSTSSSSASLGERVGATYRRHLANHPFLLF